MHSGESKEVQSIRRRIAERARKAAILNASLLILSLVSSLLSEISIQRIDSSVSSTLRKSASLFMSYMRPATGPEFAE